MYSDELRFVFLLFVRKYYKCCFTSSPDYVTNETQPKEINFVYTHYPTLKTGIQLAIIDGSLYIAEVHLQFHAIIREEYTPHRQGLLEKSN